MNKELVYKKRNKVDISENSKYHQGVYIPKNKEKCLSKINQYRSSWELKFMRWCDNNPLVVKWGSEVLSIPYKNPVKNLEYCVKNNLNPSDSKNWGLSNYWTDFAILMKDSENNIKKYIIEIKPFAETQAPKNLNESASLKEKKRFNKQAQTYLVNIAKWKAAEIYCRQNGMEFLIITERTLDKWDYFS